MLYTIQSLWIAGNKRKETTTVLQIRATGKLFGQKFLK